MSIRRTPTKRKTSKSRSTHRRIIDIDEEDIFIPYSHSPKKLTRAENEEVFGKYIKDQDKPFSLDPSDPRIIRALRQVALLKDSTIIDDMTGRMIKDSMGLSGATNEWGTPLAEFYHNNYKGRAGEEVFIGDKSDLTDLDYDRATDIVNIHKEQLSELKDPLYKYDDRVDIRLDKRGTPSDDDYTPYIREIANRRKRGLTLSLRSIANDQSKSGELRLYLDDEGRIRAENGNKWTFAITSFNRDKNPLNVNDLRDKYDLQFAKENGKYLNYFSEESATILLQDWLKDPDNFDNIDHLTISPEVANLLGLDDKNDDGVVEADDSFINKKIAKKVINLVDRRDSRSMEWATALSLVRDANGEPVKKDGSFQIRLSQNKGYKYHIRNMLGELGIDTSDNVLSESELYLLMDNLRKNDWQKPTKNGTRDANVTIPKADREAIGLALDGTFNETVTEQMDKEVAKQKEGLKKLADENTALENTGSPIRYRSNATGIEGDINYKIEQRLNKVTGKKENVVIVDGYITPSTFGELMNRQNNFEGAKIKKGNGKYEGEITLSMDEAKKLLIDVAYDSSSVRSHIKTIGMSKKDAKLMKIDDNGDVTVDKPELKEYKRLAKIKPSTDDEIDLVYHQDGYFEIRAKNRRTEDAVNDLIFDTFSYNVEVWDKDTYQTETVKRSLLKKHRRGGRLLYMLGSGKISETKEKLEEAIGFKVKIYDPRPSARRGIPVPLKLADLRNYQQIAVDEALTEGNGVVVVGTGGGKTVLSAGLMGQYGKGNDVVFIAHNKFLLGQAGRELSKFLGVKVGSSENFIPSKKTTWDRAFVPSDQTKNTPDDQKKLNINVISVQSANRALSMDEAGFKMPQSEGARRQLDEVRKILDGAELIVLDETHHLKENNTFQKTLERINTKSRYGLTATPARTDDPKILQIHSVLGRELVDFDSSWLINHNYLVPPEIYWVKAPTSVKAESINVDNIDRVVGKRVSRQQRPLRVYQERVKYQIDNNEPRNKMITDMGLDLSKKGNTVLIFVEKISHGEKLADEFRKAGKEVPFLNGEVVRDDRTNTWKKNTASAKARNMFSTEDLKNGKIDMIIATNKIFGEGADVPKIDAVINAQGNKSSISTIQKVGRALRLNPATKKKRAIVIEFEDDPIENKTQGKHYELRKDIYNQNTAFVNHDKTVTWDEVKHADDLKTTSKITKRDI